MPTPEEIAIITAEFGPPPGTVLPGISPARQAELAGTAPWLIGPAPIVNGFSPQPIIGGRGNITLPAAPPAKPGESPEDQDRGRITGFLPPWMTPHGEGWNWIREGDVDFSAKPPIIGGTAPSGVTADMLVKMGVPAVIAGALALFLGRAKMPHETEAGEGFIAPWSQMEQGPTGLWRQSNGQAAPAAAVTGTIAAGPAGAYVTKTWDNASKDGRLPASVQFMKMSNGTIYTRSLITGEVKKHRPKKHIVISKDPRLSTLKKLDKVQTKVQKIVRKYAPKKKSTQAPSAYLSTAEKKLLAAGGGVSLQG